MTLEKKYENDKMVSLNYCTIFDGNKDCTLAPVKVVMAMVVKFSVQSKTLTVLEAHRPLTFLRKAKFLINREN